MAGEKRRIPFIKCDMKKVLCPRPITDGALIGRVRRKVMSVLRQREV